MGTITQNLKNTLELDAKLEDKAGNEQNFQSCWSCPFTPTSMIDAAVLQASFHSRSLSNQSRGKP